MSASDAKLAALRAAWAKDWAAMKAGAYVPPLPHPAMVVRDPGAYQTEMRLARANDAIRGGTSPWKAALANGLSPSTLYKRGAAA